jgi:hypothetical protein
MMKRRADVWRDFSRGSEERDHPCRRRLLLHVL